MKHLNKLLVFLFLSLVSITGHAETQENAESRISKIVLSKEQIQIDAVLSENQDFCEIWYTNLSNPGVSYNAEMPVSMLLTSSDKMAMMLMYQSLSPEVFLEKHKENLTQICKTYANKLAKEWYESLYTHVEFELIDNRIVNSYNLKNLSTWERLVEAFK